MPLFKRLAVFATGLTLLVIVLGAWVRLTDAGLGCPDWPGCYGMITWPATPEAIEQADRVRADRPVDTGKAFREMLHRYVAGFLGFLVLLLAILAWRNRHQPGQPVILPAVLLGLIVFQSLLGMWTVTLLLKPAVVVAHLAGGLLTFVLLWWLVLRTGRREYRPPVHVRRNRAVVVLATVVLAGQILLGGWVSTNYAALACPDFPTCMGQWWPEADFVEGFTLWREVGVDYEGGVLDHSARVAIHLAHRIGAVAVVGVFGWLVWRLARTPDMPATAALVAGLLAIQVGLGIYGVLAGLPLAAAVAHNAMAAVLLAALVYLIHRTTPRETP